MTSEYTILNPGIGGDVMDETGVTYVASPTLRKRPRVVITGEGADEIATVHNQPPSGTEYGLITRQILSPNPGTQVVHLGSVTLVPSGFEATVATYTVPSDGAFHFLGFVASGNVNAKYRLYVESTPLLSGMSSVAVPTINISFPNAIISINAGDTIRLKVTHYASGIQADFEGTIVGYTL